MDQLSEILSRTAGLHYRIARDAGLTRCRVRCEECKREQDVYGARALRSGWPECCGFTMTLLPSNPELR